MWANTEPPSRDSISMDSAESVRTISEVVEEVKLEGFDVRLDKLSLVFPTMKVLVVHRHKGRCRLLITPVWFMERRFRDRKSIAFSCLVW